MATREIPNNMEAEQSVLGAMLLSPFALSKACDALTDDSFYYDNNKKVFGILRELSAKRTPIDTTTVITELKNKELLASVGGVEYITELFNIVPTSANIEHYIKIVEDASLLRKLIEVSTDITALAYDKDNNINETIDNAERKILSVVKNRRSTEFRDMKDVINATSEYLKRLSMTKGDVTGIPTGWEFIDKLTTGLHPNQFIIIAARPAMGKTAWALNLATNVAINAGKSVALFNLEMGVEQLATRMIASLGQIEGHKLSSGNLDKDWDRVNEALSQLESANLFMDDTPGVTIGEIRSKCRRLANSETGLDMVIIDYLQLITSGLNYNGNRQQEVSDISRSLKMMAMELGVPVIALAQLSRAAEQRRESTRPQLNDLRESGSLEQDADIVAFLYREDYYDKSKEREDQVSESEFIVRKHRNGATKTIPLRFKRDTSTFFTVLLENNKGESNE